MAACSAESNLLRAAGFAAGGINAVVVSGYQPGVMPSTFGKTLSPEELSGLVAFLSGTGAN